MHPFGVPQPAEHYEIVNSFSCVSLGQELQGDRVVEDCIALPSKYILLNISDIIRDEYVQHSVIKLRRESGRVEF